MDGIIINIYHNVLVNVAGFVKNMTRMKEVLKFPSEEDLSGAASALVRLQDLYRLDTAEVAQGLLNGIKYRYARTLKFLLLLRRG